MAYRVAAFYQFLALSELPKMQLELRDFCLAQELRGTVLLAPEGINGTIAGSAAGIEAFVEALRTGSALRPALQQLELKFSSAESAPFQRLKIRVKREIVTLNHSAGPLGPVGVYVRPEDWNAVLADGDTLVIDTRNDFEVGMGSFSNAVNSNITRFSDFVRYARENLDPKKHRRIAMFCTGGIRCEKASAFLLAEGFPEVLHLQGGILNYLETIQADKTLWQGQCFVFDERIALSHENFTNQDKNPQAKNKQATD